MTKHLKAVRPRRRGKRVLRVIYKLLQRWPNFFFHNLQPEESIVLYQNFPIQKQKVNKISPELSKWPVKNQILYCVEDKVLLKSRTKKLGLWCADMKNVWSLKLSINFNEVYGCPQKGFVALGFQEKSERVETRSDLPQTERQMTNKRSKWLCIPYLTQQQKHRGKYPWIV